MVRSIRYKLCDFCELNSDVLYRIKYQKGGSWVFVCPACWQNLSQENPFYQYGGTWKAKKKH